ncbi:T9SS type A sorting domain-containing protein [bacterium]|nr:T9SS type A sorting domain-containing protein [bacterium]
MNAPLQHHSWYGNCSLSHGSDRAKRRGNQSSEKNDFSELHELTRSRKYGSLCLLTSILFLSLLITTTTFAQLNFDRGNAEVIVRNSTVDVQSFFIVPVNLIFDDELAITHRYKGVHDGFIVPGYDWGFDGPWSGDPAAGDVEDQRDTLGCSDYQFSIGYYSFTLNLIDAKWGAGTDATVYTILIDIESASACTIYLRSPGAQGSWSSGKNISDGDSLTYWDLVKELHNSSYVRERTSYNGETFHVDGDDNLLPLPSIFVDEAFLDVNLAVHTDIAVPERKVLLIEGFDEGLSGNSDTELTFDASTGMDVYGSLRTGQTTYRNSYIYCTSAESTPAPGDWRGIHCDGATQLWLNRLSVGYASTGLYLDECEDVETYSSVFFQNSFAGLRMGGGSGIHQALRCTGNGSHGILLEDTDAEIHDALIIGTSGGSGIAVGAGATARLYQCESLYNGANGISVAGGSSVIVDSSALDYNVQIAGGPYAGVYGFYNDTWITLRHSTVVGQYMGVCLLYARLKGYESDDTLARNCIGENDYNLYGYYGTWEFARDHPISGVPHYYGGENSIYDPVTLQGWFQYSTAYLQRNYWDGNTIFDVDNSNVVTVDALTADSVGCIYERGPASPSKEWNMGPAATYASWEALTVDSLRSLLSSSIAALTPQDIAVGFGLVRRKSSPTVAEAFYKQAIASSTRPEVRQQAWRFLASLGMDADDWSGASQSLQAMALQCNWGDEGYRSSQAMAALTMHWGGATAAALASLDTLLRSFPGDRDLVMVENWIGGNAMSASPKQGGMLPTEEGYELHIPHPNPFTTTTTVGFSLPESRHVRVSVYDMSGREVQCLADGMYPAGTTQLQFKRGDLPSGMYLVRLTAGNVARTRMMHLLK